MAEQKEQLMPKKKMNKKPAKKSGTHKMPDGHMMADSEMKKHKKRMGSKY